MNEEHIPQHNDHSPAAEHSQLETVVTTISWQKRVALASVVVAMLGVAGVAAMTATSVFVGAVADLADDILGLHWLIRVVGVTGGFLLAVAAFALLLPERYAAPEHMRQAAFFLFVATTLSAIMVLLSFAYMA